jgi:hypothetical protein
MVRTLRAKVTFRTGLDFQRLDLGVVDGVRVGEAGGLPSELELSGLCDMK